MRDVAKTNANWRTKEWWVWVPVDSPMAKLASHELCNSAPCAEDPVTVPPISVPDPPMAVPPIACGDASLEDFRLWKLGQNVMV